MLAGRRQRADRRDREELVEDGRDRDRGEDDRHRPHRADGQLAERPAIEPADAHLRPGQRAGIDDQQPDQPDVDERLEHDRGEAPDRPVDRDAERS